MRFQVIYAARTVAAIILQLCYVMFAPVVSADNSTMTAQQGSQRHEGFDMKVAFTLHNFYNLLSSDFGLRYKFKTQDGTAKGGTGVGFDYTPTSGTIQWKGGSKTSIIIVPTRTDGVCESDETFKLILTDSEIYYPAPRSEWVNECETYGAYHYPCRFETEVTIVQSAQLCGGSFGE